MTFKDVVARDIRNVFMNPDELAEKCTVEHCGEVYKNITASLQQISESDRQGRKMDDYAQGLHRASAVFFCAAEDLGGGCLRKGKPLEITRHVGNRRIRRKYFVVSCSCEMGMVEAELEEVVSTR